MTSWSVGEGFPPARVYVLDGDGLVLAQLPEAWGERTFATMAPGRALVTVPESEPLLRLCRPEAGVMLAIESDLFPLVWAGVLVGVSGRPNERAVDLEARSFDAVLAERFLPSNFAPDGTSGAVFRALWEAVEAENPSGVELAVGAIAAGVPFPDTNFGDRSLADSWSLLARQTGHEWWLEHVIDSGRLRSAAHFRPARGEDHRGVAVLGGASWPSVRVNRWRISAEAPPHRLRAIAGASSASQAFSERARVERRGSPSAPIGAAQLVAGSAFVRHGVAFARWPTGDVLTRRADAVMVMENLRGVAPLAIAAEAILLRGRGFDRALDVEAWGGLGLWRYCRPGDVVSVSVEAPVMVSGYDGPAAVVSVQPVEHLGILHLVLEVPGAS